VELIEPCEGIVFSDYVDSLLVYNVGVNLDRTHCSKLCWITKRGGESVIEKFNPF
jgi:hypothetical protein